MSTIKVLLKVKSTAMKIVYNTLVFLLLVISSVDGQAYNAEWLFGYDDGQQTEEIYGGTILSFGKDTVYSRYQEIDFFLYTNAQINNKEGQLILVTEGCSLFDGEMNKVHAGFLGDYNRAVYLYCDLYERAYPTPQGVIILPNLYDDKKFKLFRIQMSDSLLYITNAVLSWDISLDDKGNVSLSAHDYLIEDVVMDQFTATHHGNGMDWWMIIPRIPSGYYIVRLGREGVEELKLQEVPNGPVFSYFDNSSDQSVISPDGSIYVHSSNHQGVWIYDFDRCIGELSNKRNIPISVDTVNALGVAISPDNRLLYVSMIDKIVQYDLKADDIAKSGIIVAEYDGHTAPLPATLSQMMLAPNDRIIVASSNSVTEFTQIFKPNERGVACDVRQHSLKLKTLASSNVPNFPNFRAGRLIGSPCDTLLHTGVQAQTLEKVEVFPNPIHDRFNVRVDKGYDQIEVIDISGKVVYTSTRKDSYEISGMRSGIYSIRLWRDAMIVAIDRIVVLP